MKRSSPDRACRCPTWPAALLLGACLAVPVTAQTPEPKTQPIAPPPSSGLAPILSPHPGMVILGQISVGQPAPDFELDGSRGVPVKLSTLRGNWVLLVFADRKESIETLSRAERTLREHGIHLVAVCNEKAHSVETYAARTGMPFLLLADVTGEVSAMYGLWDRVHTSTVPGFALIDRKGVVQIALLGRSLPVDQLTRMVIDAAGNS